MTTIPPYPRPQKRHVGHQCTEDKKHSKHPKHSKNKKTDPKTTHKTTFERKIIKSLTKRNLGVKISSNTVELLTKRLSRVKIQSSFIELLTKQHFGVKDSVINHRITHKKTFPSNQTVIKSTHRGIHDSQPISDIRRLNSLN